MKLLLASVLATIVRGANQDHADVVAVCNGVIAGSIVRALVQESKTNG